jgi:hypothetical protein
MLRFPTELRGDLAGKIEPDLFHHASDGWSPIDTNVWSPSGSLQHLGEPI